MVTGTNQHLIKIAWNRPTICHSGLSERSVDKVRRPELDGLWTRDQGTTWKATYAAGTDEPTTMTVTRDGTKLKAVRTQISDGNCAPTLATSVTANSLTGIPAGLHRLAVVVRALQIADLLADHHRMRPQSPRRSQHPALPQRLPFDGRVPELGQDLGRVLAEAGREVSGRAAHGR
jgi:hypothetical protein